jgi:hypothetical protein
MVGFSSLFDQEKIYACLGNLTMMGDTVERMNEMRKLAGLLKLPLTVAPEMLPSEEEMTKQIAGKITQALRDMAKDGGSLREPILDATTQKMVRQVFVALWTSIAIDPYKREIYEQQKKLLKDMGIEKILARGQRMGKIVEAVLPGVVQLIEAAKGTDNDDKAERRSLKKFYTEELFKMSYDELVARSHQRYGLVPMGTFFDLAEKSAAQLTQADLMLAIATFAEVVSPARLAKAVYSGLALAKKASDFLEDPANKDATSLSPALKGQLTRYGRELLAIATAAKDAIVATKLPLFTRFDEVVEGTRANRLAVETLEEPKAPATPKRGRGKALAPKPGEKA